MATSVSGVAGVTQDQFLQLLIAQLQNQDPLNPVSNEEFISQVTSLNTLAGIQELNASFAEMLKLQQITQGVELIGKTVTYRLTDGSPLVTGTVDALNVLDGKIFFRVNDLNVALDRITTFEA